MWIAFDRCQKGKDGRERAYQFYWSFPIEQKITLGKEIWTYLIHGENCLRRSVWAYNSLLNCVVVQRNCFQGECWAWGIFSSFIMYESRIYYQMDYCTSRGLITLSAHIQLNVCKGCQSVFCFAWIVIPICLFTGHWNCVFITSQTSAFRQEKSPGALQLLVCHPSCVSWSCHSASRQGEKW